MTNYIFPVTYAKVATRVRQAAQLGTEVGREYSYQDDLDVVCAPGAMRGTVAAFTASCAEVGLRANPQKTKVTPGRAVDVASLPGDIEIEP